MLFLDIRQIFGRNGLPMCNLHPISVITPCFNAASTIAQTIESVIGQVVSMPVWYHVQDGLSTDGTQDILAEYEKRITTNPDRYGHISFTWCSDRDTGMYDAINKAFASLNIPSDAFMGWINADDILLPGALARVREAIAAFPHIDWVGGTPAAIDMSGNPIPRKREAWFHRELLRNGLCDDIHWDVLQQEGTFWKKCLWDTAGGLDTSFRLAGDWDLWRRMAIHADYVQLSCSTGVFRRRPGQLSENIKAYQAEIERKLKLAERRKALRRFLPALPRLTMTEISFSVDSAPAVRPIFVPGTYKTWIRLLLVTAGLYGTTRWLQRLAAR